MEAIKREKYICIQEFMVRDLGLKGNELIVYALIFGFSQDDEQFFSGSLTYIANWINASKSTAQSIIKSLLQKGYLVKKENFVNNVKFCEYKATVPEESDEQMKSSNAVPESGMGCTENRYEGIPDSGMGCTENRYEGVPESGTNNNIYNNNINNNNKYILSGLTDEIHKNVLKSENHTKEIKQIVEYLNERCGTNYRYQSSNTIKQINARLNEGFTVEDFYKVIDTKYADWGKDSDMCKYLRPQTLFRPANFESYLNQRDGQADGITEKQRVLYNALIIE